MMGVTSKNTYIRPEFFWLLFFRINVFVRCLTIQMCGQLNSEDSLKWIGKLHLRWQPGVIALDEIVIRDALRNRPCPWLVPSLAQNNQFRHEICHVTVIVHESRSNSCLCHNSTEISSSH